MRHLVGNRLKLLFLNFSGTDIANHSCTNVAPIYNLSA